MTDPKTKALKAESDRITNSLINKEFDIATLLYTPFFIKLFEFLTRFLAGLGALTLLGVAVSIFITQKALLILLLGVPVGLFILFTAVVFVPREIIMTDLVRHCALKEGLRFQPDEIAKGFVWHPLIFKLVFFCLLTTLLIFPFLGMDKSALQESQTLAEHLSSFFYFATLVITSIGVLLCMLGGVYYHKLTLKEVNLSIDSYQKNQPHRSDKPLITEQ